MAETLTIARAFHWYVIEHVRPQGQSVRRVEYSAKRIREFFGPDRDVVTQPLVLADYRRYADARIADGVCRASIRRELTMLQAALNHNFAEERLPAAYKLPMKKVAPSSAPRRRFLSKDEWARVLEQPMSERLRRALLLLINTGCRSQAGEELTWDRIDLVNGIIDFNVPGRRLTKKRRAIQPISDQLRTLLIEWKATAKDDYVIGLGPSGRCTTTYHQAKAAMRAAGIDEFGVARHVCRKSFASWRLQAGRPIAEVAGALGDTVMTTERAYSFILPEHLRATMIR
jgi:integrase